MTDGKGCSKCNNSSILIPAISGPLSVTFFLCNSPAINGNNMLKCQSIYDRNETSKLKLHSSLRFLFHGRTIPLCNTVGRRHVTKVHEDHADKDHADKLQYNAIIRQPKRQVVPVLSNLSLQTPKNFLFCTSLPLNNENLLEFTTNQAAVLS